jgi:hypothetical protein
MRQEFYEIFLGCVGDGVLKRVVLKKSPSLPPQTVAKLGDDWSAAYP